MRRATFSPRSLGWSLLLGLLFSSSALTAQAQGTNRQGPGFGQQISGDNKDAKAGAKEAADTYILVLPKDSTRQIEMSTRELISEVRSENPKVVKVQAMLDNPRAALVTGITSGSARIYLTDAKKNTESLEIRVPLDEEADREAKRRDFLEQVRKAVPTATVDAMPSGNGTVVLTGYIQQAESVQVITELARGTFGLGANVVNAMRVGGVQQVAIEVTIARVDRSKVRNIGFSWLQGGNQHFVSSSVSGGGGLNQSGTTALPSVLFPVASLSATPNVIFGIYNDKQSFFGYLNALTTEGLAKLWSNPSVMTLSGRPGYIVSGGETPILTASGTGAPSVTYKMFGTVVNFLPIVMGNGKIHLEVRPEISNINNAAGISIPSTVGPSTSVPGFDLRTVQVAVIMEDGQTLAIGGLIQNTINATNNKVPILGDIPFLAFAFTNKTYKEEEEEMIILVTPHLVDPMACNQLPKRLPGRETRTPDDFELFLEGILEAPRGQRNLTHPYTAAYLNGPSASVYPCGDQSGTKNICGPKGCDGTAGQGTCNCATPAACTNPANPAPIVPTKKAQEGTEQNVDIRPAGEIRLMEVPVTPPPPPPQTPAPSQVPATLPPLSQEGTPSEPTSPRAVFGPAVMTDPR